MALDYVAEYHHTLLGRRPRKRARLGWDVAPAPKADIGGLCGQEASDVASLLSLRPLSDQDTSFLFPKVVARAASPPWREDDKDGHYMFAIGDNLTPRYKIYSKMGEGTFGQVLECWDREKKEMVAVKVVRGIKKYKEAAMIEIDVLQKLLEQDKTAKRARHCFRHTRTWNTWL